MDSKTNIKVEQEEPYQEFLDRQDHQVDFSPMIGAVIFFRISEKTVHPALVQGTNDDGTLRLWVFDRMSVRPVDAAEGQEIGQWWTTRG
jgi:hypothetical protein